MEVIIKAYLQEDGATTEVRRIPVSMPGQGNSKGIFKETFARIGNAFPGLAQKVFSLKWKDSDEDLVIMSSDEEMQEALSMVGSSPLKVFITVEGVKKVVFENTQDSQSDASQEASAEKDKTSDHQKQDPFMSFGFGDPLNFCGMRKRGHPDSHNPRGHFGYHFMGPRGHHFEHMGPRGHHFGHMGPRGHHFEHMGPRGHHFGHMGPRGGHMGPRGGHMGPRGHHFEHMGPRGHHFEHHSPRGHSGFRGGYHLGAFHMGMQGPFGGQDFFEGQQPCDYSFQGADLGFGPLFGHRHDKHQHGDSSWRAKLREAVPVSHRRWAKTYIRNWRVQNLRNATSTSGDSDQEFFTMETASVPEAYAAWLDIILPKWHKRQRPADEDITIEKEKNSEEKTKLNASVPLEFRKWTKWYLARHFGKKDCPKFRKDCPYEGKIDKLRNKYWKKSLKMQTLSVTIPREHRKWARTFICNWRQEHNVPDARTESDEVSTENEELEKAAEGNIAVPDDYVRWMRKVLAKWHVLRGKVDVQKVGIETGVKGEFKDSVPKNFRKWVKCFLWCQYCKGTEKEEESNNNNQYQKWLKAFQQKWLQEQSKEGFADELVLISSDDEPTARPSDEREKSMENSFKKLHLQHKRAHMMTSDTDSDDFETCNEYLEHALGQWDGRTVPGAAPEGAADDEQISPLMYKWMAKKMVKMQKKKMKKEFKQAKRSMKAAMKAQRYGHF